MAGGEKRALVIIPTYNERENITHLIPLVPEQAPDVEILIVDDNSPDGTATRVEKFAETTARVHLHRRERKLGLGTAYVAGFRFALEWGYDLEMATRSRSRSLFGFGSWACESARFPSCSWTGSPGGPSWIVASSGKLFGASGVFACSLWPIGCSSQARPGDRRV